MYARFQKAFSRRYQRAAFKELTLAAILRGVGEAGAYHVDGLDHAFLVMMTLLGSDLDRT